MPTPSTSWLHLGSVLLVLLFASGCSLTGLGDDSVTVEVTVWDINTGERLPNARVGLGYTRFLAPTDWIQTTETDASGQVTFDLAECDGDELIVNAFGGPAPGGGSFGPSKQYIKCTPGDYTVTLELARY